MRTQAQIDVSVKRDHRTRFYSWIKGLQGLSRSERQLMRLLAKRADEDGLSKPRQDWIADELGVSVKTVKRAVSSLLQKGLIERSFNYTKRGYRTSNTYRLCWEKSLAKSEATKGQNDEPPKGHFDPDTSYRCFSQVGIGDSGDTCILLSILAEEVEGGDYAQDGGIDLTADAAWRLWQ